MSSLFLLGCIHQAQPTSGGATGGAGNAVAPLEGEVPGVDDVLNATRDIADADISDAEVDQVIG